MDDLCHNIRNATTIIRGLIKRVNSSDLRLEILQQAERIEKALIAYQLKLEKNNHDQDGA